MKEAPREVDYHQTINWKTWKTLFSQYIIPYRHYFVPLAILTIIVAACDASFSLITRHLIDEIVTSGKETNFIPPAILFFSLAIIISASIFGLIIYAGRISLSMMYDLREKGFTHLQDLSFSYYDNRPVGWLMARMTTDCARLADTIAWGSLDILWSVPFLIGIASVMFYLNWKIALITLSVIPVLCWISLFFKNMILASSRDTRKANSQLTAAYNEGISGVITSKTLVLEKENLREFTRVSESMWRASSRNALQIAAYFPFVLISGSIATGLVLWIGGAWVLAGVLTLGTLVAFINYSGSFYEPVLNLARVLADMQTAQASAERIFDILDTKPEITDSPEVLSKSTLDDSRINSVEFKDVSFGYERGNHVLQNFNFKATADTTIALVGPTGSGKTTITSLLCRFYEPSKGGLLLNGIDYRRNSIAWLQSKLGIVLQTPHLFNGTIRENIRYGKLNASDKEVIKAAKTANAHDFIISMDKGYDTIVGEGGNNLSTGEKQLISLARAVMADPDIFILDEATSSVDTKTEFRIQKGLEATMRGRINFVIAHRLSTIRSADIILVIHNGILIEKGSHVELMQKNGMYYDLHQKQFSTDPLPVS